MVLASAKALAVDDARLYVAADQAPGGGVINQYRSDSLALLGTGPLGLGLLRRRRNRMSRKPAPPRNRGGSIERAFATIVRSAVLGPSRHCRTSHRVSS